MRRPLTVAACPLAALQKGGKGALALPGVLPPSHTAPSSSTAYAPLLGLPLAHRGQCPCSATGAAALPQAGWVGEGRALSEQSSRGSMPLLSPGRRPLVVLQLHLAPPNPLWGCPSLEEAFPCGSVQGHAQAEGSRARPATTAVRWALIHQGMALPAKSYHAPCSSTPLSSTPIMPDTEVCGDEQCSKRAGQGGDGGGDGVSMRRVCTSLRPPSAPEGQHCLCLLKCKESGRPPACSCTQFLHLMCRVVHSRALFFGGHPTSHALHYPLAHPALQVQRWLAPRPAGPLGQAPTCLSIRPLPSVMSARRSATRWEAEQAQQERAGHWWG